jgi:plasmid stabilization system protein ParE
VGYAIEILSEAEQDIRDSFLWYFERNPVAANGFLQRVARAIDDIQREPLSWPADTYGRRKRLLTRYPFSIVYVLRGETVS